MAKNILFDTEARSKILQGVRMMKEAVGCTMGPDGKTMLIDRGRLNKPVASKDGVTVAKHIQPEDPEVALGARVVLEASTRTNDQAGDATTCAVVLSAAMIEEGIKHVVAGRNVNLLRKGILRATNKVVEKLAEIAVQIEKPEQLMQIATVSSQDETIGETIMQVMQQIGPEGSVTVELRQSTPGIEWEVLEGMQIDQGMYSNLFVTSDKKAEFNQGDVAVLVTDDPIMRQEQLIPMLDLMGKTGQKSVLIVSPHIDSGAMGSPFTFLLKNKLQGNIIPVFVKCPEAGQRQAALLNDIATYTGAKMFSSVLGCPLPEGRSATEKNPDTGEETLRKDIDIAWLGRAAKVIVTQENTAIVGGNFSKERMEAALQEIKGLLENTSNNYEREFGQERLGNLTSGVGVIRVAASTEFETEELRLRVDDALASVRSAVQEGVLPGGGVGLLRCLSVFEEGFDTESDDERIGIEIVRKAIQSPAWQIATISGEKGDWIVGKTLEEKENMNFGFDSEKKKWGDMVEFGIIDPKRAIRCALENAASVAATFLTMHGTITEIPQGEQPQAAQGKKPQRA